MSGAIRQALTPAPHNTRPASSPENPVAAENTRLPTTATPRKPSATFLGPCRSSQVPSGNCVAEKPRKYPPASSPRSRACSENSWASVGARVAVTARTSADKK